VETFVLRTRNEVIRALVMYTDWWQPSSSSVIRVGVQRSKDSHHGDGMPTGLLDRIDERTELCRRMRDVNERDRTILFLWYVKQLAVDDIARAVGISRRHCFRRKAAAISAIVDSDADSDAA
jgi:DNA-directed RNA polymerase specialized sigma subunit